MKKGILIFGTLFLVFTTLYAQNVNFQLRSVTTFPNESISGVWAYEKDGREYALVAGAKNLHIVDVSHPDSPFFIVSLPMVDDWGKEVRVFKDFAYLCAEDGAGLIIYDLKNIPSSNHGDYPKNEIKEAGGYKTRGHTLHIDTSAAMLYLNDGGSLFSWLFKLLPDPFVPEFTGFYEVLGGIHDGYAGRDTLFAAHIQDGFVAIVDLTDKSNQKVLSTFETPGKFPHNTWLTRDGRHLLVADEIKNGYVSIWDISDLDDIREVSRFRPTPGSGTVPHNAFILGDYAFASWYLDGVIMLDLSRPENIVQVGRYDTSPQSGDSFDGSWGNCPYLSSGNILVSDRRKGLFVLTPTYIRACYVEGTVQDFEKKTPLAGVQVFIASGDQIEPPITSARGEFRTGQSQQGEFNVVFYKNGYRPLIKTVELKPGEVCRLDVELIPLSLPGHEFSMLFLAAEDNQPLANIEVAIRNATIQLQTRTDAKGWARIPMVYSDSFDVFPAVWGRLPLKNVLIDPVNPPVIRLERGYYDDFFFDLNWISEGDAEKGFWERGSIGDDVVPFIPIVKGDMPYDLGNNCYTTGLPTQSSNTEVKGGAVRLVSPAINLEKFRQPVLKFGYWFLKLGPTALQFSVFLENETDRKEIWSTTQYASKWTSISDLVLSDMPLKGTWRLVFEGIDTLPENLECCILELGVDEVSIRDGQPMSATTEAVLQVDIYPNPFHDKLFVRYLMTEYNTDVRWQLFDVSGRQLLAGNIDSEASELEFAPSLASGVYFFHVQQGGDSRKILKVVKF